jgi:hypothetical protein
VIFCCDFLLAKPLLPVKVAAGSEQSAFWGAICALPQALSPAMSLASPARTCRQAHIKAR